MSNSAKKLVDKILEGDDDNLSHEEPEEPPFDAKELHKEMTRWPFGALQEIIEAEDLDPDTQPDLPRNVDFDEFIDDFEVVTVHRSWRVFRNDDAAEEAAVAQVKDDLENEPSSFNQQWLSGHIDTEKLNDALWEDYEQYSLREQYESEEEWRDFLIEKGYLDEEDFNNAEGNELEIDRDLSDKIDNAKDSWVESQKDDFDGMSYLEDIYGKDKAVEEAMRIAGLDLDAAAQGAVDVDGWQHFLARYDGNSHDLRSGAIYCRVN